MVQEQMAGLSLMIISLLLLRWPNQIWKVTEAWKNSAITVPSKGYIIVLRCVGVFIMTVGFIVFM